MWNRNFIDNSSSPGHNALGGGDCGGGLVGGSNSDVEAPFAQILSVHIFHSGTFKSSVFLHDVSVEKECSNIKFRGPADSDHGNRQRL